MALPTNSAGNLGYHSAVKIDDPPAGRHNATGGVLPGGSFEKPDGLDEYNEDFQNFANPDDRMIADIQKRRRQARPCADAIEKTAPPVPGSFERPVPSAEAKAIKDFDNTPVRMTSKGLVLIVGRNAEQVRACGRRLSQSQPCLMLVEGPSPPEADNSRCGDLLYLPCLRIRGHLGSFQAVAGPSGEETDPTRVLMGAPTPIDLVLDLRPPPEAGRELAAAGYYAVSEDDTVELERVLAELPQMIGVFEKPRFVRHAAETCAHVGSGSKACARCIAVCPMEAIGTAEGSIRIDHAACLGCGMCTLVCPTGAMDCLQTSREELLAEVQGRLSEAREAKPATLTVVFHPPTVADAHLLAAFGPSAVRIPVAEIGCVGPEMWLSALASGAGRVAVQLPNPCPIGLQYVLFEQLVWVRAALAGLGLSPDRIRLVPDRSCGAAESYSAYVGVPPAEFLLPLSKRTLIRQSLAHLALHSETTETSVDLPPGAAFGSVAVDEAACTLCMACVGACPTAALSAGGDAPALKFRESECFQCGRCRDICPEHAVALQPRIMLDPARDEKPRRLYSQEPFACIRCGRAFAPSGMVAKMIEKLDGHWMYGTEEEKQRLKMCRDCRVRDIYNRGQEGRP